MCSAAVGHEMRQVHTHTRVHQNRWVSDELPKRQSLLRSQTLVHTGASRSTLHNNRQQISVKEK